VREIILNSKSAVSVNTKERSVKYTALIFCLLALIIILYVLFKYPQPGVADQGDFNRVMFASGLELADKYKNNPDFHRYFDFIVTDYKISSLGIPRMIIGAIGTSISYFITLAGIVCKILGRNTFKTEYLAVVYSVVYIFSLIIIIRYINIKNRVTLSLTALISLFVFFDGNYLVWFNSLYGEPMMITTLMLYIAASVYYIYHKGVLNVRDKIFSKLVFIFIAAILLLGSKMQVITAMPVIVFMFSKLIWENRRLLRFSQKVVSVIMLYILIIYPIQISYIHKPLSKDTHYNSVFYGILKNSENPRQDLTDLGLNPDMAVEAGKHSYLDKKDYVKYVPHTEITENEFYSKISNGKLAEFYITHPFKLIQGMEYTAGKSFFTGTVLGKHSLSYSKKPIREFNRFTAWSSIRNRVFPKKLIFIVLIFMAVLAVSIFIYIKNRNRKDIKAKIHLFWTIILIGALQFPMPFVGNGQADTEKQLFLFNFIFDIILVVSVCWILDTIIKLVNTKRFI
jgi:hypothetical protein